MQLILIVTCFLIVNIKESASQASWWSQHKAQLSCSEPGYFVNPADCHKFYRCVDRSSWSAPKLDRYDFECPNGMVFDTSVSVCSNPGPSGCAEPWFKTQTGNNEGSQPGESGRGGSGNRNGPGPPEEGFWGKMPDSDEGLDGGGNNLGGLPNRGNGVLGGSGRPAKGGNPGSGSGTPGNNGGPSGEQPGKNVGGDDDGFLDLGGDNDNSAGGNSFGSTPQIEGDKPTNDGFLDLGGDDGGNDAGINGPSNGNSGASGGSGGVNRPDAGVDNPFGGRSPGGVNNPGSSPGSSSGFGGGGGNNADVDPLDEDFGSSLENPGSSGSNELGNNNSGVKSPGGMNRPGAGVDNPFGGRNPGGVNRPDAGVDNPFGGRSPGGVNSPGAGVRNPFGGRSPGGVNKPDAGVPNPFGGRGPGSSPGSSSGFGGGGNNADVDPLDIDFGSSVENPGSSGSNELGNSDDNNSRNSQTSGNEAGNDSKNDDVGNGSNDAGNNIKNDNDGNKGGNGNGGGQSNPLENNSGDGDPNKDDMERAFWVGAKPGLGDTTVPSRKPLPGSTNKPQVICRPGTCNPNTGQGNRPGGNPGGNWGQGGRPGSSSGNWGGNPKPGGRPGSSANWGGASRPSIPENMSQWRPTGPPPWGSPPTSGGIGGPPRPDLSWWGPPPPRPTNPEFAASAPYPYPHPYRPPRYPAYEIVAYPTWPGDVGRRPILVVYSNSKK